MKEIYIFPAYNQNNDTLIYNLYDKENFFRRLIIFLAISLERRQEMYCYDNDCGFLIRNISYDLNDLYELEIFYKLKKYKLITHNSLIDNRYFDYTDFGRFNSNKSLKLLDHSGIDVNCLNKKSHEHAFGSMKIPEFIDYDRYIFHKIKDFFDLDFKEYFRDFVFLKTGKDWHESDFNTYIKNKNIQLWSRFFENNKHDADLKIIKKTIKNLIDNKENYALKTLNRFINNRYRSVKIY